MEHTQNGCLYEQLENGIHLLTYTEASRYAVDSMIGHLDTILKSSPVGTRIIRVLTDSSRADSQPFQYMISRLKELIARYPNHPNVRSASLFDGGAMMGPADILFRMISRRNKFRIFRPVDREKAVEWLLSNQ